MSECGAVPAVSLGAIVGGALRLPVPCQLAVVHFLLAPPGPRHLTDSQHDQTLLPIAIAVLVLPASAARMEFFISLIVPGGDDCAADCSSGVWMNGCWTAASCLTVACDPHSTLGVCP